MTKSELQQLSIRQLRLIDITKTEDEALIQEVINEKLEALPPHVNVKTSDVPDIKTPEEEARWQKTLDERRNAKKDKTLSSLPPEAPDSTSDEQKPEVDKSIDELPVDEAVQQEFIDHEVTEEDLQNNPELANEGVAVGDVIQVPKEDETPQPNAPTKPLDTMKKDELIAYATELGLEFDPETVTNNPQRVKAIEDFLSK